jgi:hypothetical protein
LDNIINTELTIRNPIYTKLVNANITTSFNLNYADNDVNGNAQFVNSSDNSELFIDTSSLTIQVPFPYYDAISDAIFNYLNIFINPNSPIPPSSDDNSFIQITIDPSGTATSIVTTIESGNTTINVYNYRLYLAPYQNTHDANGINLYNSGIISSNYPTNAYFLLIGDVIQTITSTISTDRTGIITTYTYNIPDNCILLKPNGFYGKLTLNYSILQKTINGNISSFNTTKTDIYILPRPNPQISIQRFLNNVSTDQNIFYISDNFQYQMTIKNGSEQYDYDYINIENDTNISNYLNSLQKLHIDYINDPAYNITLNSSTITNSIISFDKITTLQATSIYNINGSQDVLNWNNYNSETSVALYNVNASATLGGIFNISFIMSFNNSVLSYPTPIVVTSVSDMITIFLTNMFIQNNINVETAYQLIGIPFAKGIKSDVGFSLISTEDTYIGREIPYGIGKKGDLSTCTTLIIKNIGSNPITILTTNLSSAYGGGTIYFNPESDNSNVIIGPGNARVFIRIMFNPEAWEPMNSDYVPDE